MFCCEFFGFFFWWLQSFYYECQVQNSTLILWDIFSPYRVIMNYWAVKEMNAVIYLWSTCSAPGVRPELHLSSFSLTVESVEHTHTPSMLSIRLIVGGSSGVRCRKECSLEWRHLWVNIVLTFMREKKVLPKLCPFLRHKYVSNLCSKSSFPGVWTGVLVLYLRVSSAVELHS